MRDRGALSREAGERAGRADLTFESSDLITAPQINVTIIPARHSRMLVAGIQKESLDARSPLRACGDRLRGHDGCELDTQLCGAG